MKALREMRAGRGAGGRRNVVRIVCSVGGIFGFWCSGNCVMIEGDKCCPSCGCAGLPINVVDYPVDQMNSPWSLNRFVSSEA